MVIDAILICFLPYYLITQYILCIGLIMTLEVWNFTQYLIVNVIDWYY